MNHSLTHIRKLPSPSVKKLLREAGTNQTEVARSIGVHQSLISRVIRKDRHALCSAATRERIWQAITDAINAGAADDAPMARAEQEPAVAV